ncbi:MAG: hypothetical protein EH225_01235, partial [Calditrichaeota bacterium]
MIRNFLYAKYRAFTIILLAFISLFTACATLDNLSKGQFDRLKGTPFYKTYGNFQTDSADKIFHLSVDVSRESKMDLSYEDRKRALGLLLKAIEDYVDSLNQSLLLPDIGTLPEQGAPSMYVGSSEGENAPPGAETLRQEHDKYPPMMIYVEKPSKEWKQAFIPALQNAGGQFLLILNLSFDQYPKADRGLFQKKVVLGTEYEENINFFSAEDKPVEVLQITGMILNDEGKIIRAGAEGILAKDTPFYLQIFDIEEGIDNKTLRQILENERREDLPGNPLKWKVATHNLVNQLLNRK